MAIAFPTPNMGDPSTLIVTEAGITWTWNNTLGVWSTDISSASDDTAIGDTPPASPQEGDLWWNSNTGQLFLFYQDATCEQWVAAATSTATAPEPTSDQIVAALLNALPSYASISAALGAGVPVGGLFKLNGATSVSDIRAVASYS